MGLTTINSLNATGTNQQLVPQNDAALGDEDATTSSLPEEEDDVQSIIEYLSSVQSPQLSEITSRSALVEWAVPVPPENLILNAGGLRYHVLLSDRGKEGKYKVIFKGFSLSCRVRDLRPGQEYSICLQV